MSFLSIDRVGQTLRTSKIRGVQLAIVVDNKDGEGNPGYRVKVKFPWLTEQETSFWARIAVPMAGSGRGTYVLPEIDDQVLVVFEHGDINRPIVVGSLWSKKQEPVEVNQSGKNNTKLIKSRSGHRIIFDDKEGAEKIIIVDKTKKNKIILDSVNKIVKIESDGDIEVKAKTNVILHSNALKVGAKESITGKAQSLLTHAQKTFGLKATSGITISGGNTTINVSNAAATSVSGSGAGELGGAPPEQPREPVTPSNGSRRADGSRPATATTVPVSSGATTGDSAATPIDGDLPLISPDQIEVLVLNVPGDPEPNVVFDLKLPDGTVKAGETSSTGFIRFSGLTQSGNAHLNFPDLDDHLVVSAVASQPDRVRYVQGGVDVPIGTPTRIELQPRIRRGRLTCMRFETDKSFLLPSAMCGVRGLVRYYAEHPKLNVLVNGHTDRAATETYNLDLSMERATAIADFLRNNVDGWVAWYSAGITSKRWGTREDQHMLATLPDNSPPFYAGPIDGIAGPATTQAINDFQAFANSRRGMSLTQDGIAGPETRRELVKMYMELEGTTLPEGTPLEMHGCGEFHPLVPTADGVSNDDNRRVEVYFFEGPIDPAPRSPCPAPGCPEYTQWVARTIDDVDLCESPPAARYELLVLDERDTPIAGLDVIISAGGADRRIATDTTGRAILPDGAVGGATARIADSAQLAKLTEGWAARARRVEPLPSDANTHLVAPIRVDTTIALAEDEPQTLMLITRVDVEYVRPYSPWTSPALANPSGPWLLTLRDEGFVLALHSDGKTTTAVVQAKPILLDGETLEFFHVDVDKLVAEMVAGERATLDALLVQLASDPPLDDSAPPPAEDPGELPTATDSAIPSPPEIVT